MQCTARRKNGTKCGNDAIKGGRVCRMHGGAAPQVKKAAALRLAELVDPAIGVVARSLRQRKDPRLALHAAKDVLDRNGYKSPDEMKLTGSGLNGAIQLESVSNDEQLRLKLARILARTGPRGVSE